MQFTTPKKRPADDDADDEAYLSSKFRHSTDLNKDNDNNYTEEGVAGGPSAAAPAVAVSSSTAEDEDYYDFISVGTVESDDEPDFANQGLAEDDDNSINDDDFIDADTSVNTVELTQNYHIDKSPNEERDKAIMKMLRHLDEKVIKQLVEWSFIYLPNSPLEKEGEWKDDKLPQLKNVGHACIYFRKKGGKFGRTTNGRKRWYYYRSNENDIIYVCFDYDLAPVVVLDLLEKFRAGIEEIDGVHIDDIDNLTYGQVENLDGISIYPRLVYNSMRLDEALKDGDITAAGSFGGIGNIAGIARAIDLQEIEMGLQYHAENVFPNRGFNQDGSDMMEHVRDGFFPWQIAAMKETVLKSDAFDNACNAKEKAYMGKKQNVLNKSKCLMSWPRKGEAKRDMPSAKIQLEMLIMGVDPNDPDEYDVVNGTRVYKGRVQSAVQKPPPDGSVYGSDSYTKEDLDEGVKKMEAFLQEVEEGEGIRIMDSQRILMKHLKKSKRLKKSGDAASYLASRGWRCFFKSLDLQVFRFKAKDGKVRLLFLHDPLCYLLFSGTYNTKGPQGKTVKRDMNWNDVKSQARRAKTAQLLFNIFHRSRESSSPSSNTTSLDDRVANTPFFGSILSAFCMRIFLIMNLHVHGKSASLVAKNLLNQTNYFEGNEKYHGLGVSQYGRNLKEQRSNKSGSNEQNFDIVFMLLASLTGEGGKEEVIENFTEMLFSKLPGWPTDKEGLLGKVEAAIEKYQISESLYGSIWDALGYSSNSEERRQALLEERRQSHIRIARAKLESKQGDEGSVSDYSIPSDC